MYPILELSELVVLEDSFIVPIHPALLRKDVTFNPSLVKGLFERAIPLAKERLDTNLRNILKRTAVNPRTQFDKRKFVTHFAYGGAEGPMIFFNPKELDTGIYNGLITLSGDKLASYQHKRGRFYCYSTHNVQSIIQATMLQTWAVLYLNAALKNLK